jgi:hypothetical protein
MNTQQQCCEKLKILQNKSEFPFSTVALYDAGDIAGWLILGIITHFSGETPLKVAVWITKELKG